MHAAIHMKRDHRRNEMPIVGRTVQISSIERLDRILELVSTWLLHSGADKGGRGAGFPPPPVEEERKERREKREKENEGRRREEVKRQTVRLCPPPHSAYVTYVLHRGDREECSPHSFDWGDGVF